MALCAFSAVPSEDPPSTTTIAASGTMADNLEITLVIVCPSCKAGITIATKGRDLSSTCGHDSCVENGTSAGFSISEPVTCILKASSGLLSTLTWLREILKARQETPTRDITL